MKKLLAATLLVTAAACNSSTAPVQHPVKSHAAASHDLTCKSGYVIAYDENGEPYCVADNGGN